MELEKALPLALRTWEALRPYCVNVKIAGSIRRKRSAVKDIELVAIPKEHTRTETVANLLEETSIERTERVPQFAQAVRALGDIVKGQPETGKYVQLTLPEGIALDLFIVTPEAWGLQLAVRTGSAEFSKMLAKRWVARGYHSEGGRLSKPGGSPVECPTEEAFFSLLRLRMPPPEERELTAQGLTPYLLA